MNELSKRRFTMYISILVIAGIVNVSIPHIKNIAKSLARPDKTISVGVNTQSVDDTLKENFINSKSYDASTDDTKIDVEFKYSSANSADVILAKTNDAKTIDGYEKHDKMFYSPIVCFGNYSSIQYSSYNGMSKQNDSYHIDLKKVFDTFLADEKWKTIDKDGFEKDITIIIPESDAECFDEVKEFIRLNMSKTKDMTEKDENDKVNSIIKKCQKKNMENILNDSKYDIGRGTIIIAPEFYYRECKDSMTIMYGKKTNAVYFDCFIKNKTQKVNDKTDFDYNTELVNLYQSSESFSKHTFLRTDGYEHDFDFSDMDEMLDIVEIPNKTSE